MTKVVVYHDAQGALAILIPANNVYVPVAEKDQQRHSFVTFSESAPEKAKAGYRKATIEEIAERDIPEGVEWHVVERAELPQDRYFRGAWRHEDGAVSVDMDKAREIHKSVLRDQRSSLLAALDLAYIRADEAGDAASKTDIAVKKQALRDVTKHPSIDAATTPEELKVAALSVLERW